MASERLKRSAVQWGALALVAQLWIALAFVHAVELEWRASLPRFSDFQTTVDRMSQLKAGAFKFPWLGVYASLAIVLVAGIVSYLWIAGVREAMAPEPESTQPDEPC